MKLGGVRDGIIHVTEGFTTGTWDPENGFSPRGRLPQDRVTRYLHGRPGDRFTRPFVGEYPVSNLWPIGEDSRLASTRRWIHRSEDGGRTWHPVHELPRSSGMMGVLPTSVTVHDGRVYLAEYPLGDEPARILVSDTGRHWEPLIVTRSVRHFHAVIEDPFGEQLWATAGDRSGECAIGVIEDNEFRPIGGGSQRWRAVDLAFTPDSVIWGMDCSYADRIDLLKLDREQLDAADPTTATIGHVDGSVFYTHTIDRGNGTWIVVATAAEFMADSTAPDGHESGRQTEVVRAIAASSRTNFREWHPVVALPRRPAIADRWGRVPSASAYVFLADHPAHGLLVNPYNTVEHGGSIIALPHAELEAQLARAPAPEPRTPTLTERGAIHSS